MNIDILNAYCGIGFHRCHACLRVGLLAIASVLFWYGLHGRLEYFAAEFSLLRYSKSRPVFSAQLWEDKARPRGIDLRSDGGSEDCWFGSDLLVARKKTPFRNGGQCRRTVARLYSSSPPPRSLLVVVLLSLISCCASRLRNFLFGFTSLHFTCRPEIRRDYPLNLSISLSGGKETNKDSPSNGE